MESLLNPYRPVRRHCHDIFGGELETTPFGEFGMGGPAEQLIMHSTLRTPSGFVMMGSDTPPGMPSSAVGNVGLSLSGDDEAALRGYWASLPDGGEVQMDLERQMWGDLFGQCTDLFSIRWMLNIASG